MKSSYKYKELIEFYINQSVNDGAGGTINHMVVDYSDYAQIKTIDERRVIEDTQTILEGYYEIYLRFRTDKAITKNHLIKLKSKQLTIHSIVNINELDNEIKLICSESDNTNLVFENVNPYENYQ